MSRSAEIRHILTVEPDVSYTEVGYRVGCSRSLVSQIARELDLPTRQTPRHVYDKAAVLADVDAGVESFDRIAARHGITVGVISGLASRRRKQLHQMARASRQSTDTLSASGA